ncbi:hypothetical protein SAMN02799615_00064 [Dyella marensis]|jgi:hypothetical protein|uniref:Uncharacterized protein n=1 Tax=Dyella marensis TaxID=500610 RepID=A0A1I1X3Q8_9GAMM|nr:hypothetical protein SAMN02799615_00064 [Dyella marensis]
MEVRTVTASLDAVSADPVAISGQKDNHPPHSCKMQNDGHLAIVLKCACPVEITMAPSH